MDLELTEEPITAHAEYARIPIAFTIERVFDVTARVDAPGSFMLSERHLDVPYQKDYDAIAGEGPSNWASHSALSQWTLFGARVAARRVGGAAVAIEPGGVDVLEGRHELAVLWDIRVSPDVRRSGVGSALFATVEAWARRRRCRHIKVETQNTNVPACRFYERQGCELRSVHRAAYARFPEEIQLLWYKDLR